VEGDIVLHGAWGEAAHDQDGEEHSAADDEDAHRYGDRFQDAQCRFRSVVRRAE
jgi:hypothetical protein